jgi:hypothetical protein
MAPSLSLRPRTGERPPTRDNADHSLIIPSRTSSLHSRITQPLPSTLNVKQGAKSPKTLTHAYMVCGVGREPSQWVKAPAPAQGKIGHMKGAVGTFWLPEILGSSPRLEQDNDIARSLHAAMRVSGRNTWCSAIFLTTEPGMFPSRRRDLHRQESAALCTSLFRIAARLVAHALRYRIASLVSRRREACRNNSRPAKAHRARLLRQPRRNILDPLLS